MTVKQYLLLKRFHKSLVRPHMDNLEKLEAKPEGRLKQLADFPYVAAVAFVVLVGLLFWVAFK